jgi:hypothetical protein
MKTSILVGLCAASWLGTAVASGEQQDASPGASADNSTPKSIPCAQETGESLGHCTYRTKRDDNGKTTVTVAFANGFKRRLFFKDGAFVKASTTMSGTGTDTDWKLKNGTHKIRVDDQRYEVPDSLIAEN